MSERVIEMHMQWHLKLSSAYGYLGDLPLEDIERLATALNERCQNPASHVEMPEHLDVMRLHPENILSYQCGIDEYLQFRQSLALERQ
ncbi:hypothetical protein PsWM33_00906 [Pseudovibrio sp. WM33]|nr:hypothetical protein PsWM33_00906 [Pseudovibrio sp. WM33]